MLTIKEVNKIARSAMFDNVKVPSGISNPVLREEGGRMYIAYFGYTYDKRNLMEKKYRRPCRWLLADIATGEVAAKYDCNERDFSEQSSEKLYSMADPDVKVPNEDFYSVMDTLFDTARASWVFGGQLDAVTYQAYLKDLYSITPREYAVFYQELDNKGGRSR